MNSATVGWMRRSRCDADTIRLAKSAGTVENEPICDMGDQNLKSCTIRPSRYTLAGFDPRTGISHEASGVARIYWRFRGGLAVGRPRPAGQRRAATGGGRSRGDGGARRRLHAAICGTGAFGRRRLRRHDCLSGRVRRRRPGQSCGGHAGEFVPYRQRDQDADLGRNLLADRSRTHQALRQSVRPGRHHRARLRQAAVQCRGRRHHD